MNTGQSGDASVAKESWFNCNLDTKIITALVIVNAGANEYRFTDSHQGQALTDIAGITEIE